MTADDFRAIALSLDGSVEQSHMGHPDFRAGGRIFATLHHDDKSGTVMLAPEEQRELMRTHPRVFEPSSGAWGRQGATNVRLDIADEPTVRGAMLLAWQNILRKASSRRRANSSSSRGVKRAPRRKAR
ncbi:MAG TPA: MmcQ/YjbR family DNA-binding protein [Vicinamibacterales bacterium]|jgi:hypothetical protein